MGSGRGLRLSHFMTLPEMLSLTTDWAFVAKIVVDFVAILIANTIISDFSPNGLVYAFLDMFVKVFIDGTIIFSLFNLLQSSEWRAQWCTRCHANYELMIWLFSTPIHVLSNFNYERVPFIHVFDSWLRNCNRCTSIYLLVCGFFCTERVTLSQLESWWEVFCRGPLNNFRIF